MMWIKDVNSILRNTLLLLFGSLLLVVSDSGVNAQTLTINGSVSAEQINLGLPEASGRPGVGLAFEWEANRNFFVGANGYLTTDASPPNRTRNVTTYAGVHWDDNSDRQYDLTLLYRIYPGKFAIDWDYPELRFDVGVSPNLGFSLTAANDFYGLGVSSIALTGEYVVDFSPKYYSRLEGGHVSIDSSSIDSYSFAMVSAGLRGDRWSVEGGYRINNAVAFPAFRDPQIENRFLLSANWLIY